MLIVQLWGALCGAILGAVYTRAAALQLLLKNQALEAAGIPALPGAGHLDTLASWAPAVAGAVFFGLSLGLGWGTLLGLWARLCGAIPGRFGRWMPWAPCAVLPAGALWAGDSKLAAAGLAASVGAAFFSGRSGFSPRSEVFRRILVMAIVSAGLIPWALAPEGPFTRFRDRYLLGSGAGLGLNELYYRWTLYPAECLKPLDAKSQPTVALPEAVAPSKRASFCNSALRFSAICLPARSSGADAALDAGAGGLALRAGPISTPWPSEPGEQAKAWRELSERTDKSWALRRGTFIGLFTGFPIALCWWLAALPSLVSRAIPRTRLRTGVAVVGAALLGALVGLASLPDPQAEALKTQLTSSTPPPFDRVSDLLRSDLAVVRFYAALDAPRLGKAAEPLLVRALSDPVVNVRYAAALGLGAAGDAATRAVLLETLRNPEEWYVKERAYAALWRLGWRPR